MAREMYGITALDPKVAATEKFIQDQQIPPDKVEDFLLSMGADPKLASLVFKYRRVQEAAKKQQNQPPTASVDQEVSNQYAQLKQQERMGQGVAGMPAPNLARAPMQGGITGQPMPRMAGGGIVAFAKGGRPPRTYTVDPEGNVDIGGAGDLIPYEEPVKPETPRNPGLIRRILGNPLLRRAGYAGLGLTALGALLGDEEEPKVEGATVEEVPDSGLSDENIRLLAAVDEKRRPDVAIAPSRGVASPRPPKFEEPTEALKSLSNIVERRKARVPKDEQAAISAEMEGEREYLNKLKARGESLAQQEKEGVSSPEKKFWLAFAQAGFAASAKGARNLWETLSIGGIEGVRAYEAMKDKEQQLRDRLQDKRFQLEDLSAQIKRGVTKAGRERYDSLVKEVDAAESALVTTQVAVNTAKNTRAGQIYEVQSANARAEEAQAGANQRAAMAASLRGNRQKLEEDYYADIRAAQRTTDPDLRAALLARAENTRRAREQLEQTESGFQSSQARLEQQGSVVNMGENDGFSNVQPVE